MGSDFNGDGFDDILWRYSEGNYYLTWHGTESGGYIENGGLDAKQIPSDWLVWGLGDFNGDGRDDILWRHSSGLVINWLGTSGAAFVNNHSVSAMVRTTDWRISGVGDFDGDGKDDVLWRHENGLLGMWMGTTQGAFADNKTLAMAVVPNDWTVAGVADFNGDGHDDILWRHSSGLVTDWLSTAAGGFANNHVRTGISVPNDWTIRGTGDFNGDGLDDVVWQHSSGLVTTWLGRTDGGFFNNHLASAFKLSIASGTFVAGTGDYNGDGRDDILIKNGDGAANLLATADGSFVDNSLVSFNYFIDGSWSAQPNPAGLGYWDY